MSTAYQNCGSEIVSASVSDSHCNAKPVFPHATDQDCKNNRCVEREMLGKITVANTSKYVNEMETTRCGRSIVTKPLYQPSAVVEKVFIGFVLSH